MNSSLVSQRELLELGWTRRQIEAALDEPDDVGPCGHWLNTSGTPYYNRDRVSVAAYRIGLQKERPTETQWRDWAGGTAPTSLPVMTTDFHRLAEKCQPGVANRFGSLRLSHPFAGRLPGTEEAESELIEDCLIRLIKLAFDTALGSATELDYFLRSKSENAVEQLGSGWPEQIIVRPAKRASYVSKANSRKAITRFIYAISLIQSGAAKTSTGTTTDVRDFLICAPRIRFDQKITADPGELAVT